MNQNPNDSLSVLVERDLPHPPEKIWRALTQPHLIAEWLQKTDFKPELGHRFNLDFDWGQVECQVETVEPNRTLTYTWDSHPLKSVVTWTLTPTDSGTRLRMEQQGFKPDQPRYYQGAQYGWPRFFESLEQTLAKMS